LSDTGKINKFLEEYPEHRGKALTIDRNGNIKTAGGRVLAVWSGGAWSIKNLGGRPTKDPLKHDIRVRVTDRQYEKLSVFAADNGLNRAQAVRKLIDEV
jgi:hypothetical protein